MDTRNLTELIAAAPWREESIAQHTWPHECVLIEKDGQQDLLAAVCARFKAGEGVPGRFAYLFIGDYKYWLRGGSAGDYVLNRARLYRDRRDFVARPGGSGMRDIHPAELARPEDYGLLAAVAPWLGENGAVEAFKYILNKSKVARDSLVNLLGKGGVEIGPLGKANSQVRKTIPADKGVTKDLQKKVILETPAEKPTRRAPVIPDLVIRDKRGRECLMVELKFKAGLQDSQPNGYLRLLPDDVPAVLLFVVPSERRDHLWDDLLTRVHSDGKSTTLGNSLRVNSARVGKTNKHIMLVSWDYLLGKMASRARRAGETPLVEDEIQQLRCLANRLSQGQPSMQNQLSLPDF